MNTRLELIKKACVIFNVDTDAIERQQKIVIHPATSSLIEKASKALDAINKALAESTRYVTPGTVHGGFVKQTDGRWVRVKKKDAAKPASQTGKKKKKKKKSGVAKIVKMLKKYAKKQRERGHYRQAA